MRASRVPKKKARLKGRGLRWRLKQIARDYQTMILVGYLIGDYLDDGVIDLSLLQALVHVGVV